MRRLVLVGGGHAHAQVIDDWIRRPIGGVELWVVSSESTSPYSGMVPGWLAGLYAYEEICIDIAALCLRANAVFVKDEMDGLDPAHRRIRLRSSLTLDYDVLSLNVGSTLYPPAIERARVLPLRPLSQLRGRWDETLSALSTDPSRAPLHIVGVGGGAAGFESLLALRHRLASQRRQRSIDATLITAGNRLLPGLAPGAVRRASVVLNAQAIKLKVNTSFDDTWAPEDSVVVWATGAQAHRWQSACALALSANGYFLIDRHLRSVSHPEVFAVGDCAEWEKPLPKAGVYAVRMGPVLSRNLRAALGEGGMQPYNPQQRHLVLLSTADGRAIASRGSLSASGAWTWAWKDYLDRKFVRRFEGSKQSIPEPQSQKGHV